ncbi:hypothetical protein OA90_19970 [Labrenzia sp. OB1]|nr:hypothetical protein OA90_19970 [Labrenzia sp. OB1]
MMEPGDELHDVHAVPSGDFLKHLPEKRFQAHGGDHSVNPQGFRRAFPKPAVGIYEEFAHWDYPVFVAFKARVRTHKIVLSGINPAKKS